MIQPSLKSSTIKHAGKNSHIRKVLPNYRKLMQMNMNLLQSPDDVDKRYSSRNDPTDSVTSQRQRTYNKICIFCGKASKYRRGSRSREPLRQCAELRADAKVREIAEKKMDNRILAITTRELVAAEACYHNTCYKDYTRIRPDKDTDAKDEMISNEYSTTEAAAFQEVRKFMRHEFAVTECCLFMTDVYQELMKHMKADVEEVRDSTKTHLRRKIEKEFGETIEIINLENR